jgi:hypothetical protein
MNKQQKIRYNELLLQGKNFMIGENAVISIEIPKQEFKCRFYCREDMGNGLVCGGNDVYDKVVKKLEEDIRDIVCEQIERMANEMSSRCKKWYKDTEKFFTQFGEESKEEIKFWMALGKMDPLE